MDKDEIFIDIIEHYRKCEEAALDCDICWFMIKVEKNWYKMINKEE